jgi:hypothetical protein
MLPRTAPSGIENSTQDAGWCEQCVFITDPPTTPPTRAPSATHVHALPCRPSSIVAVDALAADNAMWPGIDCRKAVAESRATN